MARFMAVIYHGGGLNPGDSVARVGRSCPISHCLQYGTAIAYRISPSESKGMAMPASLTAMDDRISLGVPQDKMKYLTDRRGLLQLVLALMSAMVVFGCGTRTDTVHVYPTQGVITYRGHAIPGAFVALHPKSPIPNAPNPRATVARDGTFALSTFDAADGAPAGEYVLTVQWYRPVNRNGELSPGPNVLPRQYETPRTSRLQVTVAQAETRLPPIDLR